MMVRIVNIFSLIVFIGVLSTSVIGSNSNEKSQSKIINRSVESETLSESNSDDSTTVIYLETAHEEDPAEECECTPFNLCKTYESTEDGGAGINIRSFGPCDSYLDVCCKDKSLLSNTDHHENSEDTDSKNPSNTNSSESSESPSDNCSCEEEDNNSNVRQPSEPSSESSSFGSSSESSSFGSSSESSSFGSSSESSLIDQENGQNNYGGTHECGKWNKQGVGFRIFNDIDSETQFSEFPSMIAIFKEEFKNGEKNLVYLCGGSLIKTDVVLTAAHCVIKVDPNTLVIRAGDWDIKTTKEIYPHKDILVQEVVTHPDYKSTGLHNDIALIFTKNPFTLAENVQLMCIPEEYESYVGDSCITIGWGKTVSYNNFTITKITEAGKIKKIGHYEVSILKKVELPIVPNDKCMEALKSTRLGPKFVLHDSFMCAGGEKDKDACRGDGGSPLMCPSKKDSNYLVQVGIVSWGISCGVENIPGVYVNVAGFRKWIDNELEIHIPNLS